MSGHSKWATTKRAKAVNDAKKAAIFTKLGKIITIAARDKGGDLDTNFSLRMAVDKAKQANMPKENIERAIKRGTGEVLGSEIEELIYEGIGPVNSQYIIKSLTDNKNRSASNIRHIFNEFGGSLGSVMWNFSQKGVIRIVAEKLKIIDSEFDNFELGLIENGAQDIKKEEEGLIIFTNLADLQKVKKFLEEKEIETESAEIEYIAKDEIKITEAGREKIENFEAELDDCEDVGDYYSNVSFI